MSTPVGYEPVSPERSATPRNQVPVWFMAVAALVILAGLVMLVMGAWRVGVTWDERVHAVMLEEYFSSGWYASPDWLVNGQPEAFLGKWPYYVYAPVAELVGHVFTVLAGAEPWGGFSDSPTAYAYRHLASGLVALVGIVAAGLIARLILPSWRWALVAAAFVASTPMWIGHGMFNVKDLPVGTGYTLATLGFVALCRPDYFSSTWLRVAAFGGVVSGTVLAVGTRPASGLPIALTGLGLVGLALLILAVRRASPAGLPRLGSRVRDVLIGLVGAYVLLVAIYPRGFINPLTLVKESILISGRFPVSDEVLTNGVWLPQPPPWTYLPTWFGAQMTIVVLLFSVGFAVVWLAWVVRAVIRRRRLASGELEKLVLPGPVVLQTFLLPAMAIAAHSTMYNAVRQFLFVVPALAVLATLGVAALVTAARRHWPTRAWVPAIIWVAVAVGVVVPVVDQLRLFPYNYVYFNEIATLKPVNGNWATDYWRASSQELAARIPSDGFATCRLPRKNEDLRSCETDSTFMAFWDLRGSNAVAGTLAEGEFWFVRENNGDVMPPPGCSLHDTLTRPLKAETVVIGQVFRCDQSAIAASQAA